MSDLSERQFDSLIELAQVFIKCCSRELGEWKGETNKALVFNVQSIFSASPGMRGMQLVLVHRCFCSCWNPGRIPRKSPRAQRTITKQTIAAIFSSLSKIKLPETKGLSFPVPQLGK